MSYNFKFKNGPKVINFYFIAKWKKLAYGVFKKKKKKNVKIKEVQLTFARYITPDPKYRINVYPRYFVFPNTFIFIARFPPGDR